MSEALVWHLIRDSNSFMVKRGRTSRLGAVTFSSEPGNPLGAHCFKYSGIANNSTVDISGDLVLKTKDPKVLNKLSYTSKDISSKFPSKVVKEAVAAGSASRPDLVSAIKTRAAKTAAGARAANGVFGRKRSKKGVKKVTKRTK
mmetsp:Transcript_32004/g.53971  ORF Transcript_32004/g.53971 Transcript_32004/m.53971 type:complete len:144 (-) Transcript_32004:213-644(-)|eukprot:CAMPEP_0174963000 /NCGR_PEP_ID=MMETSP0004_2-20121128/5080_1 /TAXON_ID=420556 /ORGANISM="Ochromonas sp., Strain CCMP1393" /LENGTH=143 /DNA_ID=CAMNT_0016211563 /DNA_START=49 /DNA_END=480 /DNA_ORIENTATION=-